MPFFKVCFPVKTNSWSPFPICVALAFSLLSVSKRMWSQALRPPLVVHLYSVVLPPLPSSSLLQLLNMADAARMPMHPIKYILFIIVSCFKFFIKQTSNIFFLNHRNLTLILYKCFLCLIKSLFKAFECPFRAFECRFKAFEQTFPNYGRANASNHLPFNI